MRKKSEIGSLFEPSAVTVMFLIAAMRDMVITYVRKNI